MSFQDFVTFFLPFIFTGLAIYLSFFLTKLNHRIKKRDVITVWLAMSLLYVFFPYAPIIFSLIPYVTYIFPAAIIFAICIYYWKLEAKKALIFSVYYGLVNLIVILSLNYILSGVLT